MIVELEVGRHARPSTSRASHPEDRVHRVEQLVVQLARGLGRLGHAPIIPERAGATRAAAACPERTQAAMPTPSYAAPATARPATADTAAAIAATRSRGRARTAAARIPPRDERLDRPLPQPQHSGQVGLTAVTRVVVGVDRPPPPGRPTPATRRGPTATQTATSASRTSRPSRGAGARRHEQARAAGSRTSAGRYASPTTATDAYEISRSGAAAGGATSSSSFAARRRAWRR